MTEKNHSHNSNSDTERIFLGTSNFERQFLRTILLYGCYNSRDYRERKGLFHFTNKSGEGNMSKGTLINENHRLKTFLPEGSLEQDQDGNYTFDYDQIYGKDHPLLFAYCMSSCTNAYASAFILIQAYLNQHGLTPRAKIQNDLESYLLQGKYKTSGHTVYKYLDLFTRAGFLEKKVVKKDEKEETCYRVADDILGNFNTDELRTILRALDFAVNTSSFPAPYYMAWRKIRLYLPVSRDRNAGTGDKADDEWLVTQRLQNPLISYPRKHSFSQLDQDQIYLMLRAIHDHSIVQIQLFTRDRYGSDETDVVTKVIVPVHIREDAWTGRMLVQCMDPSDLSLHQYRIDYINRIKVLHVADEDTYNLARKSFRMFQKYIWSTSENIPEQKDFQKVKVRFHITDSTRYVIDRVEREKLNGESTASPDGSYVDYEFTASNANDISAWLRSFGESAEVLEPVSLRDKIHGQWESAEAQMQDDSEFTFDRNQNYFVRNAKQISDGRSQRKDDDITLMAPYESARIEALTFLWHEVYKADDNLWNQNVPYIVKALFPKRTSLASSLNIEQFMDPNLKNGDMAAGILFRVSDEKDEDGYVIGPKKDYWARNMFSKGLYGDMPVRLSDIEREALAAMVRQPEKYEPILKEDLFRKLKDAVSTDMSWNPEDISLAQNWGSYASEKPDFKLISNLLTRIGNGKEISFRYRPVFSKKYDDSQVQQGYPVMLEYFPGGNRIRVVMYMKEKGFTYMMAERMTDIHTEKDSVRMSHRKLYDEFTKAQKRELVMEIKPVSFALERIVRLFSCYEKTMKCDPETSVYTMRMTYLKSDEETVVRDVLSCGNFVKVKGNPEIREKILARIRKAEKNYR